MKTWALLGSQVRQGCVIIIRTKYLEAENSCLHSSLVFHALQEKSRYLIVACSKCLWQKISHSTSQAVPSNPSIYWMVSSAREESYIVAIIVSTINSWTLADLLWWPLRYHKMEQRFSLKGCTRAGKEKALHGTIASILVAFTPLWNFPWLANLSTKKMCPEMGRHRNHPKSQLDLMISWTLTYGILCRTIFCVEPIQVISTHSHKLRTSSIPPRDNLHSCFLVPHQLKWYCQDPCFPNFLAKHHHLTIL